MGRSLLGREGANWICVDSGWLLWTL